MGKSGVCLPIANKKAERKRPALILEQMTGIGPAYSAWEADILPLNYICMKTECTAFILVGNEKTPRAEFLELMMGLEPMTC